MVEFASDFPTLLFIKNGKTNATKRAPADKSSPNIAGQYTDLGSIFILSFYALLLDPLGPTLFFNRVNPKNEHRTLLKN